MINKSVKSSLSALAVVVGVAGISPALAEGGMLDQLKDSLGAGKEAASEAAGTAVGGKAGAAETVQSAVGSELGGESSSLVDSLTSQLNVTPEQAQGGAGSLFQAAKQKLGADSFQSVADVVPGMDGLLGAAPKTEAAGGLAGGVAGLGGDSVGGATGVASVANNFQQLGLSSDMVGKFVPVVVDYVKTQGGETVANLLGSALPGF